ncbi:hypothetical protein ACN28S_29880 [Cystobacter fuscus]
MPLIDTTDAKFEADAVQFLAEMKRYNNGEFTRQDLDSNPSLSLFFARWLSAGLAGPEAGAGDHSPKPRSLATPPKQARGTQGRPSSGITPAGLPGRSAKKSSRSCWSALA